MQSKADRPFVTRSGSSRLGTWPTGTGGEPGQVVAAGQAVIRIAEAGASEAIVALPETILPAIGSMAEATVFGGDGRRFPARLRQLSDAADPLTRTYEAALHPGSDDARETALGPGDARRPRQPDQRRHLPRVAHGGRFLSEPEKSGKRDRAGSGDQDDSRCHESLRIHASPLQSSGSRPASIRVRRARAGGGRCALLGISTRAVPAADLRRSLTRPSPSRRPSRTRRARPDSPAWRRPRSRRRRGP